jgi:hypothetical protein
MKKDSLELTLLAAYTVALLSGAVLTFLILFVLHVPPLP